MQTAAQEEEEEEEEEEEQEGLEDADPEEQTLSLSLLVLSRDYRGFLSSFAARGAVSIFILSFFSPSLLLIAKEDTGSKIELGTGSGGDDGPSVRTSSLTSFIYIAVVFWQLIQNPILGVVADITPHRRLLIQFSFAAMLTGVALCGAVVSVHTWVVGVCLAIAVPLFAEVSSVPINSYLPELSSHTAETAHAASTSVIWYTLSSIGYAVVAVAVIWGLGIAEKPVLSVRVAALVCVIISAPFALHSCVRFSERPAAHVLPEGASVLGHGFTQLKEGVRSLHREFPMLARFVCGRAFYMPCQRALTTLAPTYLVTELGMSAADAAAAMTLAFIAGVPGAATLRCLQKNVTLKRFLMTITGTMAVSLAIAPAVLAGPSQANYSFLFATLWGYLVGLSAATDKAFYSEIVPGGREAEFFGLFAFTNSCLEWAPPLTFLLFNETLGNMRLALGSLSLFYLIGLVIVSQVDEQKARRDVAHTLDQRRGVYGRSLRWSAGAPQQLHTQSAPTTPAAAAALRAHSSSHGHGDTDNSPVDIELPEMHKKSRQHPTLHAPTSATTPSTATIHVPDDGTSTHPPSMAGPRLVAPHNNASSARDANGSTDDRCAHASKQESLAANT